MSLGWGDGTWSSGPWGGGTVYPTGNEANGFVGVVSPELILALTGVSASGAVGTMAPSTSEGEDGDVENGVGDGLEAGVPLAVEDGEGEVLEFREDDAVLVVGGEDIFEEVVVFEPRDDGVVGLGIPLVPVGHRGAEALEGRPL